MKAWQRWKRGAVMCGVFGLVGLRSFGLAALLVAVFILLPVELISGSTTAIEEDLELIVIVVAAAIFPIYVDLAIERCASDEM
jgi:predicted branched-subunit amino acid permease